MSTPSSRPRRCRHAAVDDGNCRCATAEKSRWADMDAKRAAVALTSGVGRATGERCNVGRSPSMSLIMNDGRRSPHDVVSGGGRGDDVERATSGADVSARRRHG